MITIQRFLVSFQTSNAIHKTTFNFKFHNEKVGSKINDSKLMIDKFLTRKAILIPIPEPRSLYGMPKLHKEGAPMQPVLFYIISFI